MTVKHVREEYWEASDGAQFADRETADQHELHLIIAEVLAAHGINSWNGLMPIARALCACPELIIMRAQRNPEMAR